MEFQTLINIIVEQVKQVDGVSAVVLGGSRARGTHTPTSDIDLGIYYDPKQPLDLKALERVAAVLDDDHRSGLVTPIGGWGQWINGGGWLTVQAQPVDFLYRDLSQVSRVIAACRAGQVGIVYQPGHPHGFVSATYLAEVAICQPLWEADGRLLSLKKLACPYPSGLQMALIEKFTWEIGFSLEIAKKGIERVDVAYAAGCCFRCVTCILQVLFALNEQYWLNEKGAVALATTFSLCPAQLQARIEEIFTLLVADRHSLRAAIAVLEDISQDVVLLLAGK